MRAAGVSWLHLKGSTFPAIWLTEQDSVELSGGQTDVYASEPREGSQHRGVRRYLLESKNSVTRLTALLRPYSGN